MLVLFFFFFRATSVFFGCMGRKAFLSTKDTRGPRVHPYV